MLPVALSLVAVLLVGALLVRLATRSSRAPVDPAPGGRPVADSDDLTRPTHPTPPPAA